MKSLFLAAMLAFAPAAVLAQNVTAPAPPPAAAAPVDADPALWVVRDEDTTVYLFGTFHMLDGRPWFNDEIRTAFDASNELVLEAIIPDNQAELQPLFAQLAIDPAGSSPLPRRGRRLAPSEGHRASPEASQPR